MSHLSLKQFVIFCFIENVIFFRQIVLSMFCLKTIINQESESYFESSLSKLAKYKILLKVFSNSFQNTYSELLHKVFKTQV